MEEALARGVQLFLALAAGYLVASWFVLSVWAYRDIGSRSKSVVTQVLGTLLVVLFWVPGTLLYLLLRPKDTIDDVYQRSLEEEYLIHDLEEVPVCQACQRPVEADYVVCPHCQADLKEACAMCGKLISPKWDICPYCASDREERAALIREQLPTTEERFIDRGERTIRPIASPERIREIPSGQREALAHGPASPSLEPGVSSAADESDGKHGAEEPIRLFDRKQTKMRNESLERSAGTSEPQNGSMSNSNGHLSDSEGPDQTSQNEPNDSEDEHSETSDANGVPDDSEVTKATTSK